MPEWHRNRPAGGRAAPGAGLGQQRISPAVGAAGLSQGKRETTGLLGAPSAAVVRGGGRKDDRQRAARAVGLRAWEGRHRFPPTPAPNVAETAEKGPWDTLRKAVPLSPSPSSPCLPCPAAGGAAGPAHSRQREEGARSSPPTAARGALGARGAVQKHGGLSMSGQVGK